MQNAVCKIGVARGGGAVERGVSHIDINMIRGPESRWIRSRIWRRRKYEGASSRYRNKDKSNSGEGMEAEPSAYYTNESRRRPRARQPCTGTGSGMRMAVRPSAPLVDGADVGKRLVPGAVVATGENEGGRLRVENPDADGEAGGSGGDGDGAKAGGERGFVAEREVMGGARSGEGADCYR